MPCYTEVLITLDDTVLNRKARRALGLPVTGQLSVEDANRVTQEAGVIKTMAEVQQLAPSAFVKRKGNRLTVQVQV